MKQVEALIINVSTGDNAFKRISSFPGLELPTVRISTWLGVLLPYTAEENLTGVGMPSSLEISLFSWLDHRGKPCLTSLRTTKSPTDDIQRHGNHLTLARPRRSQTLEGTERGAKRSVQHPRLLSQNSSRTVIYISGFRAKTCTPCRGQASERTPGFLRILETPDGKFTTIHNS